MGNFAENLNLGNRFRPPLLFGALCTGDSKPQQAAGRRQVPDNNTLSAC